MRSILLLVAALATFAVACGVGTSPDEAAIRQTVGRFVEERTNAAYTMDIVRSTQSWAKVRVDGGRGISLVQISSVYVHRVRGNEWEVVLAGNSFTEDVFRENGVPEAVW
jgi:hypothetical protein